MARSENDWLENDKKNAAAYQKWAKDNKRQKETAEAFCGWADLLEKILIDRTRRNLDHFSEYPYAEDFILGYTPEQAATQMIESLHVATLYVVPKTD